MGAIKMKEGKLASIATWISYILYIGSMLIFIKEGNLFNIVICVACIVLTVALQIVNRKFKNFLDDQLYIVMIAFVLISSLLGSCYGFYGIDHYDDFLHIWSGFIACSFAYSLLAFFNNKEQITNMNKIFIIIYLLTFSVAVAGFWEIMEFSMDNILGTNTQVGGLTDTIMDMIDGLIGAVIMIPFIMNRVKKIK